MHFQFTIWYEVTIFNNYVEQAENLGYSESAESITSIDFTLSTFYGHIVATDYRPGDQQKQQ